jgi:hypothetical protein
MPAVPPFDSEIPMELHVSNSTRAAWRKEHTSLWSPRWRAGSRRNRTWRASRSCAGGGQNGPQCGVLSRTLTTCFSSRARISCRSTAVPVHFVSSMAEFGLSLFLDEMKMRYLRKQKVPRSAVWGRISKLARQGTGKRGTRPPVR